MLGLSSLMQLAVGHFPRCLDSPGETVGFRVHVFLHRQISAAMPRIPGLDSCVNL